ncbi:MAG: putative Fe-S cluster assembly protein SufT [Gammaproteobacteria bacterium]|nr:putative Fe-S cluster assembly protein SufT [Gammaproteobacteria bacterium]
MNETEIVTLTRTCTAVSIPKGDEVLITKAASVTISQSLGGSFTVLHRGNLYRIAGDDADALGKIPLPKPTLPDDAKDHEVEDIIWKQMKTCFDPEIPINIVDLGLIYKCEIDKLSDGQLDVFVQMTLTAPGCGMGDILAEDVKSKIELVPTVKEVNVEIVFDPPWTKEKMSDAALLETGIF